MILDAYDYALPEAGTLPLLSNSEQNTLPVTRSRMSSISSKGPRVSIRSTYSEGRERDKRVIT